MKSNLESCKKLTKTLNKWLQNVFFVVYCFMIAHTYQWFIKLSALGLEKSYINAVHDNANSVIYLLLWFTGSYVLKYAYVEKFQGPIGGGGLVWTYWSLIFEKTSQLVVTMVHFESTRDETFTKEARLNRFLCTSRRMNIWPILHKYCGSQTAVLF